VVDGDPVRIAWLGHSTVAIDLDGVRILTDPLLGSNAGPLMRRGPAPDPKLWAAPDAVLLSHLHHDHAELRSLRRVPGVPVFTAPRNAGWLMRKGITSAVALGSAWASVDGSPVQVRLTKAVHRHRPMPHRPNAANGHLIRGARTSLWVAGDTSLFPEMARLTEPLGRGLDIAVVPIGGWGPRLSEGHMDARQAAEACARVGARWALPIHWGTLHPPFMGRRAAAWIDQPAPAFAAALSREAPDCRLIDLRPGDVWQGTIDHADDV
jgi:L-ascorbate metabolism protein UlaG (beta-lactamase superfamily)